MELRRMIHLTSGETAANGVRHVLAALGCRDEVLHTASGLATGPLADIDAGAASRAEWWARIDPDASLGRQDEGAAALFDELRAREEDIVLWHGPVAHEYLAQLRVCWHLRAHAQRLHEVVFEPSGATWAGEPRPIHFDSVSLSASTQGVTAWARRRPIADVHARAARWEEIRSRPGDWIRVLDGDSLLELGVDAFDTEILDCCDRWIDSLRVLGDVIIDHAVPDRFIIWRILELLEAGSLEGRGPLNRIEIPTRIRAPRRD